MNRQIAYWLAFAAVAAAAMIWTTDSVAPLRRHPPLLFLCGAGMRGPVTELADRFTSSTGIDVDVRYEGSSILRDYILTFRQGDLFLPGDEENLRLLASAGLVRRSGFVARHEAAVLVPAGGGGKVARFADLARPGLKIVMANPRMASLGRLLMEKVLDRHPLGPAILGNVVVFGSSSLDVLQLFQRGDADAVFDWQTSAFAQDGTMLDVIPLPAGYRVSEPLRLGLLATSRQPARAQQLYRFILRHAAPVFRRYGYRTDREVAR